MIAKILPFRMENKEFLDPIWNKHHIERVEVVVKETLDVKGESAVMSSVHWLRRVFILPPSLCL